MELLYSSWALLIIVVALSSPSGTSSGTKQFGISNIDTINGAQGISPRSDTRLPSYLTSELRQSLYVQPGSEASKRRYRRDCAQPPCDLSPLIPPVIGTDNEQKGKECARPPCELFALIPPVLNKDNSSTAYVLRFQSVCGQITSPRIVGGDTAGKGDWTWTVALMRPQTDPEGKWEQFCGGTLITDQRVLTAGHCVHGFNETTLRIRAGHVNLEEANQSDDAEVLSILKHPNFNLGNLHADIAIVKLRKQIPLDTKVSVCCLPESRDLAGVEGVGLGWGFTNPSGDVSPLSQLLQFVKLPIWSNADCQAKYGARISSTMFCAGRRDVSGHDACLGDSGGPFVVKSNGTNRWILEGITSFGVLPCAQNGQPGVYTRVSSYRDWVIDNAV